MVSGGTVNSDASALDGYLTSYKTEVSGLDASWRGPSYDSISSQMSSFLGEYSAIVSQMNSFANACSEYQKYIQFKSQIRQLEANRANASDDKKSSYDYLISDARNSLETTKRNIQMYLSDASSLSLMATPVSASATGLSSNVTGLSSGSSNNQALVDSLMNEVGKTISDYPGLGFHDGNWCADFVSQMLVDNGYDIKKSAVAGDKEGMIFGSLRDAGGVVHLDSAAAAKGLSNSKEYDLDYSPQPGDVVLFDWGRNGDTDHVGFVVKDNGNGTITTLEGNTSGDAGGSCVAIKTRDRSDVYGYCTLNGKGK